MRIKRIHFESLGSTNTWAKEHAAELDPKALTIVTADEQTAGRGRFKRDWVSPKGCNLYATYVVFVPDLNFAVGNLPQVLALSACESLEGVQIKWPNDLVVGKKKLAGILCEITETDAGYALVLGIGVNINMPRSLLEQIDRPATSLAEEAGQLLDRDQVAMRIHNRFASYLTEFLEKGFDPFLKSFREHLIHEKGELIRFSNFQTVVEGVFQQIDDQGALILMLSDGKDKTFTSGELL